MTNGFSLVDTAGNLSSLECCVGKDSEDACGLSSRNSWDCSKKDHGAGEKLAATCSVC